MDPLNHLLTAYLLNSVFSSASRGDRAKGSGAGGWAASPDGGVGAFRKLVGGPSAPGEKECPLHSVLLCGPLCFPLCFLSDLWPFPGIKS